MSQFIGKLLTTWGLFYSEELNVLVYAAPKCGSTSIFSSLVATVDPTAEYKPLDSEECLSSLNIHPYVRRRFLPSLEQLRSALLDENCLKLLIVRNPYQRFFGAITSKYMIPNSPFGSELDVSCDSMAKALNSFGDQNQLFEVVISIAKRLLVLDSVTEEPWRCSHIKPITSIVGTENISSFTHVIDVTASHGWTFLTDTIRERACSKGFVFEGIPRLNESPLKLDPSSFPQELLDQIAFYYATDIELFGFDKPVSKSPESNPSGVSESDLRNARLFYDVASRFYAQRNSHSARIATLESSLADVLKELDSTTIKYASMVRLIEKLKRQTMEHCDKECEPRLEAKTLETGASRRVG